MTRTFISLLLFISLVGCGVSKKKISSGNERKISVAPSKEPMEAKPKLGEPLEINEKKVADKTLQIINTAMTFTGVRYKYGGSTRKGMDCSGLLHVSFAEHDIAIPRASYMIAREGENIELREVIVGDLLFFGTSNRKKNINHVGLVVAIDGDDIKFIHSTTSRGVIVSSLREGYWNHAFIKATRIL
ncbi:MAG TPA: C40 family peptidase [Arenibacter sp.]|nr:C40 family peptidase [Arenibacter sp.]